MPPNSFASTLYPLTVTFALTTLNLIGQSLDVQAAELIDSLNAFCDAAPDQPTPDITASLTAPSSSGCSTAENRFAATPSPILVAQASPNSPDFPRDISQDLPREIPPQSVPRDPIRPDTEPPTEPPPPLPPLEDLLQPSEPPAVAPAIPPSEAAVFVEKFSVEGNTVFDADKLAELAWRATATSDADIPKLISPDLLRSYCPGLQSDSSESSQDTQGTEDDAASHPTSHSGQKLSFEQLLRARSAITQLYIKCGYITSGAILPPQTPADHNNTVTIKVAEGSLEDIEVTGSRRLNSSYVRSRLARAGSAPFNQERLLRGLRLLQLNNDLIRRISANLQAGTRPTTSILRVEVTEADTFDVTLDLNNNRSPSVGTFQRGITFNQANLSGLGDALSVSYNNTDGSNGVAGSYTIPVNPRNGTIGLRGSYTNSHVIEYPFDVLDIEAESSYYEVSFRQPIFQIPRQSGRTDELALGLSFSRQENQTELGINDVGPFPLSIGADNQGRTRVSALRFTQDWLSRMPMQVLAARSQFSLGLDLLDATVNEDPLPDSRFFAWRGQGQWVRQLDDRGTLLLARADMQLTGDSLLPLEQFGLGGQDTVRGYRQDAVLTDNGVRGSVEVQFPILPDRAGSLYLVPFLDAGTGWNVNPSTNPKDDTLIGTGIGLLWKMGNNLTAQVDWGIPLVSIDSEGRTWQESGLYFSIRYSSPF